MSGNSIDCQKSYGQFDLATNVPKSNLLPTSCQKNLAAPAGNTAYGRSGQCVEIK